MIALIKAALEAVIALPKIIDKLEQYLARLDEVIEAKQIIQKAKDCHEALAKAKASHDTSALERLFGKLPK